MTNAEAKAIAAEPNKHLEQLRLAHLKLGNMILRTMASSPRQKELIDLRANIEAMPKELWKF